MTVRQNIAVLAIGAALSVAGCAGRTPTPVAAVQASDNALTCFQIESEIRANTDKIVELSGEESAKMAQNIAAGVAGLFLWPMWFAMDFQDAAGKEGQALATRNAYLSNLHAQKGCSAQVPAQGAGGTT